MPSSMALWYERRRETPGGGKPAKAEVHINLWRHLARVAGESNFLDLGFLFDESYEVERVLLFLPFACDGAAFEDLSSRLRVDRLLSAVFNDVVEAGDGLSGGGFAVTRRKSHYLTFHKAAPDVDFTASRLGSGTLVAFSPSLCERLHAPGPHYIRIRMFLSAAGAAEFSEKNDGWGDFALSGVVSEELTEVRFNELRNVPEEVAERLGDDRAASFLLSAAHCFLIRDKSFELVAPYGSIYKMRRMESHLWKGYLPSGIPEASLAGMVVYHWKSGGPGVPSFITSAKFRRLRGTLLWYVLGVVSLGALGSGVQAAFATYTGSAYTALTILLCIAAVLAVVPLAIRGLWGWWRNWRASTGATP